MTKEISVFMAINMGLVGLLVLVAEGFSFNLTLLAPLYMFIPFIATVICCKWFNISFSGLGLAANFNKYFFIAWLLPALICIGSIVISTGLPGIVFSSNMHGFTRFGNLPPLVYATIIAMISAIIPNTLYAFGEEIGWRGFLYQQLKSKGFWHIALLIGSFWGLWHIPAILAGHNYPTYPIVGSLLMLVACLAISPIILFIRIRSNSVWMAALFHGSFNAFAGLSVACVKGGSELIVGMGGLAGIGVMIVIDIVIYFILKRDDDGLKVGRDILVPDQ